MNPIDTSKFILTSSFNQFTSSYYQDSSSFKNNIDSLTNATSSYILSSQTSSMSVLSSSYALTASYIDGYVTNSIYNTFTSSYYIDSASFNYRIENILIPTGSGSSENHPVTVNAATTTVLPRSPLYNNGTNRGRGFFIGFYIVTGKQIGRAHV